MYIYYVYILLIYKYKYKYKLKLNIMNLFHKNIIKIDFITSIIVLLYLDTII